MTWQRLEWSTVGADLLEGPEARIADPLWLLGRQWQVGELTGDDAASPLLAQADLDHAVVTRYQPGPPDAEEAVVEVDAAALPLETMVERETVRDGPTAVRLAAEAGLQLFRHLTALGLDPALRDELRKRYPLIPPPDDGLDAVGLDAVALLVARSFDARALRSDPKPPTDLRSGLGEQALAAWTRWYDGVFSEPDEQGGPAWQRSRMEYRFRVSAQPTDGGEVVLDAPEYVGGHLDWYSFDVRSDLKLQAPSDGGQRQLKVIPTTATFAGQAASRLWEMEDTAVWFGDLHNAPEDLSRVAVAGFGLTFGDDWYRIPCRLPVGSIVRTRRLRVYDSFGVTHRIRSCAELDGPDRVWRFFELTGDPSADGSEPGDRSCPWLFLAPALAGVTEGSPREEVVLLRDEVANVGWGAELRVESTAARVVDRVAQTRTQQVLPAPDPSPAWRYRLMHSVPGHLVPLLPVQVEGGEGLYLQRGRLATAADDDGVTSRGAVGHILDPQRQLFIEDAEVPSSGVRLTRTWQMARARDGGVVLWMGRRKTLPQPTGVPGLVFDDVDRREA